MNSSSSRGKATVYMSPAQSLKLVPSPPPNKARKPRDIETILFDAEVYGSGDMVNYVLETLCCPEEINLFLREFTMRPAEFAARIHLPLLAASFREPLQRQLAAIEVLQELAEIFCPPEAAARWQAALETCEQALRAGPPDSTLYPIDKTQPERTL